VQKIYNTFVFNRELDVLAKHWAGCAEIHCKALGPFGSISTV